MTTKQLNTAARIVRSIRDGEWTNAPPSWAPINAEGAPDLGDEARAIQTAEAFIVLAQQDPKFDQTKFLRACGFGK